MEALEIKIVEKRLAKYSTDQLLKKVNENLFPNANEHQIAINILTQRGKWGGTSPLEVVETPTETVDITNYTPDSLPTSEPVKEKTIREIIDEVYALNNAEVNRKLCLFFPEEFDDYEDLPEEIKTQIREFYKQVLDPNFKESVKPSKKDVSKNDKVKEEVQGKKEKKAKKEKSEPTVKVEKGETKSSKMIELFESGHTPTQISKALSAHYSFVYGVIDRHCMSVHKKRYNEYVKAAIK